MRTIILFSLLLTSCGTSLNYPFQLEWDNKILQYYYTFKSILINTFNVEVPDYQKIEKALYADNNILQDALGICGISYYKVSDGIQSQVHKIKRIYISYELKQDPNIEQCVIFHEFGHCFFDWQHSDKIYSLMYPSIKNCFYNIEILLQHTLIENNLIKE